MSDFDQIEAELKERAKNIRREVIKTAVQRKEGHIGGAFSIIESILTIHDLFLMHDDVFILSKGHAWLPLYHLLKEKGYSPKLAGHPEIDLENGVNCTTGSLGHGLPIGVGIALAKKIKKEPGNVYIIISDGECQEGTTWESLLLAAHHKLDNLKIILDHNNLQTLGKVSDILSLGNIEEKFKAFGAKVSVINGHSFKEINEALREDHKSMPRVIVTNTIKGKGVSFMENHSGWHTMIPNEEEFNKAMEELK